ncbi:MAG: anion permease [Lachnospiraceae bacterium]|nr:anion permease [Lachnospiraceae bacterium]
MLAAQIVATVIFVVMFAFIVTEKIERQYVSLGCAALVIIFVFGVCMRDVQAIIDTLAFKDFGKLSFWYAAGEGEGEGAGINWATILFIFGMMVMVEGMAKAGFFRWLCLCIAKAVKYKPTAVFVTFMLMSFVLAMFIDSITVILFLAAVTIELARLLEFDPVVVILSEIFCANLGGSATMCGDPPNIIIGTSLGYSFGDFVANTGFMAVISLVFIITYFYLVFRNKLVNKDASGATKNYPNPSEAIQNKGSFIISTIIFLIAVVLLVSHAQTGLTVATIGAFVAILTMITSFKDLKEIMKKVDYKTLLFFIGLFVVVGGLEQTGILKLIADFIAKISGGNIYIMIAIVLWVSAIASAFVDNIPFAATMIPVIKNLTEISGVPLTTLAWTLAIGTDIGGSATPIGASANVVGIAVLQKNKYSIGWGKYCKYLAPATIIVMIVCMICIYVRYCGLGV